VAAVLALAATFVPTAPPAHAGGLGVAGTTSPPPMKVEPQVVMHAPEWVLPVEDYRLTGRFGDVSGLWSSVHTGLDFAAASGTRVRSVAAGVVTETAYAGAYGNRAVVRLDDGTEAWYCHLDGFAVREGQKLKPGQLLGYVGSTGNVTGPHLHLEVRPDGESADAADPEVVLGRHGLSA
jgi:murein DD-endopeptidase MepM/ murein hydrolase activator NlpD